jgi:hypothetical protein
MSEESNYFQLFLIWLRDTPMFDRYQHDVAPVARRYGTVERSLTPTEIYAIGLRCPDIANVTVAPSRQAVLDLAADPEFQAVVGLRTDSTTLARVAGTSTFGHVTEDGLAERVYLVELARFGPAGEAGYRAYEREADAFMEPYGYRVERVLVPDESAGLPFKPDLVKVAYFDDPAAMGRMHEDPGHHRIEEELYGAAVAESVWLTAKPRPLPRVG